MQGRSEAAAAAAEVLERSKTSQDLHQKKNSSLSLFRPRCFVLSSNLPPFVQLCNWQSISCISCGEAKKKKLFSTRNLNLVGTVTALILCFFNDDVEND
jgi:hypothetical protein